MGNAHKPWHRIEMQPHSERKTKRESNNVTLLHVPTQSSTDIVWEDMGRCRLIGFLHISRAGHN